MNRQAIEHAEARLIRIPLEAPRGDAIQKFTALEIPLVEIRDSAGRVGRGFGYTIGAGGSAIVTLIRAELVPLIIGGDPRWIAALNDELTRGIHALTPGCMSSTAMAAVDVALWDLAGKTLGMPLHLLLGGGKRRVPIYNTHVGWLSRPLDEMVNLCREAVGKGGFRAVKLKVGKPDAEEDRERVAKVREVVGPDVRIMVDANQSWSIDEAISRTKSLEDYEITWMEEPLPATDVAGFKRLGKHTRIPRAGGESLYAVADFMTCVREGALDILQPDVARIGGITNAMKVCHIAAGANLKVAPHVSPELSVALAAAVTNSFFIEYIPQMEPILARTIAMEDGFAIPSDEPGHGVMFDDEALARYEVRV